MEEFVTIARVRKTQGRRGEVAADILTDFPERFSDRKRLFAQVSENGPRRQLQLEAHWFHKGGVVLKFEGVESISDAEALLGAVIQLPTSERAELEPGAAYISDLVGCTVSDSGRNIGKVAEVQFGAGEAPTLVVREGGREYLVPFVERFIHAMDLGRRQIDMQLPEGLLELDAPLTEDEKRAQRGEGPGDAG